MGPDTMIPIDRRLHTARLAALGVFAMAGLGFASVPLYRMFCQVTGFGGTTMRADAAPGATDGNITIAYDSNISSKLGWSFEPEMKSYTISIGARDMAFYTARNRGAVPTTGTATYNVTPQIAGKYFKKIQCFCFTEQTLRPGEKIRMPVIYFVDPAILKDPETKDIKKITLSYTFYPVAASKGAI